MELDKGCARRADYSTQSEFTSSRELGQYIGVFIRRDVCSEIQLVAPGKDPTTPKEMKLLSKVVTRLQNTAVIGLNVCRLDMRTVKIVVVSDDAFGNARDFRTQLG